MWTGKRWKFRISMWFWRRWIWEQDLGDRGFESESREFTIWNWKIIGMFTCLSSVWVPELPNRTEPFGVPSFFLTYYPNWRESRTETRLGSLLVVEKCTPKAAGGSHVAGHSPGVCPHRVYFVHVGEASEVLGNDWQQAAARSWRRARSSLLRRW